MQTGNKSVFFPSFSEWNINFVGQLFKTDGAVKPWKQLQEEYGLANKLKFKWIQLIHSLPKPWIKQIFIDSGNSIILAIQDHHLIKNPKCSASINLTAKKYIIYNFWSIFWNQLHKLILKTFSRDMLLNGTRSISYLEW